MSHIIVKCKGPVTSASILLNSRTHSLYTALIAKSIPPPSIGGANSGRISVPVAIKSVVPLLFSLIVVCNRRLKLEQNGDLISIF